MGDWPPRYADARTLEGKLQRGLGSGFLEALEAPREVVHPLLLDLIRSDPRLDHQLDNRDRYFGDLAFRTELDVAPLEQFLIDCEEDEDEGGYLCLCVLMQLARRGNGQADAILRDYVTWGPHWHSVLWQLDTHATTPAWIGLIPRIAERASESPDEVEWTWEPFVTWAETDPRFREPIKESGRAAAPARERSPIGARTTEELLATPLNSAPTKVVRELAQRKDSAHGRMLIAALSSESLAARTLASSALLERGDLAGMEPAIELASTEQHPPVASSLARRALLNAPAEVVLPLAREWRGSRNWRKASIALDVLKKHATPDDLPWLRRRLETASPERSDQRFIVTAVAEVIAARFPGQRFPALSRRFEAFTYSFGRHYLAEALAVTDPTFPTTRAFTALWDCEAATRAIAAEHVSLDVPGAVERLREMAADPLEDSELVREVASRRLEHR